MNPPTFTFGAAKKSTENMPTTTSISTGHFTMSQIVVAVLPIPSGSATASTIGPVSTSASATSASSTTMTNVTTICSGRSFQNGRPSGVS